jgi:glutamyl/glutaminyl-tRNA synthetase
MRGARNLNEAREYVRLLENPGLIETGDVETLRRFKDLIELPPRDLLRELRAAGGDLNAVRIALTGAVTGPELSAILAALPKEVALRRVDQALQHAEP